MVARGVYVAEHRRNMCGDNWSFRDGVLGDGGVDCPLCCIGWRCDGKLYMKARLIVMEMKQTVPSYHHI